MELLLKRRSVRDYTEQDVTTEQIEKILRAGMYAPSAGNQQGWKFVVVRNRQVLDKLSEVSLYANAMKKAPAAIVLLGDKSGKYPKYLDQDLGACAQNILLEIEYLGLGAVWLGVAPEEDRMNFVKKELNISDDNLYPFALIPFGHPKNDIPMPERYDESRVTYID